MHTGCVSQHGLLSSDLNESLKDRFAVKCGPKSSTGCIPWLAQKTSHGYGVIRVAGAGSIRTTAHRVAWVLANGDLAPEMCVLHKCDNPSCVNPEHLFVGSPKDNVDDMVGKKRHSWRERTPWQKLSPRDAEEIINLRNAGLTQQEIADRLNVSRPLISMIESGKIQYANRALALESRHR